jgi:hypothetical protein
MRAPAKRPKATFVEEARAGCIQVRESARSENMTAAAKRVAVTETAKAVETLAPASGVRNLQTPERNYSRQAEAQRSKWGVETRAVRSVHARKF